VLLRLTPGEVWSTDGPAANTCLSGVHLGGSCPRAARLCSPLFKGGVHVLLTLPALEPRRGPGLYDVRGRLRHGMGFLRELSSTRGRPRGPQPRLRFDRLQVWWWYTAFSSAEGSLAPVSVIDSGWVHEDLQEKNSDFPQPN
jgi:hypothetical protein